ncbi:ABC transporter permease subunit [Paractinoplanes hotanensis]|uniref:ABC transporter permease subunit n=1 Tax=Paractinoplanes hotanensis TaxID=2906497 RepID=A0ABT0XTT9_9ACTN|nr:ABC transporter permease subunit [Actinoplanes hotanensis]MCM4076592.1 ABC transporter permease subunit [Actinoplanes hotanensis]
MASWLAGPDVVAARRLRWSAAWRAEWDKLLTGGAGLAVPLALAVLLVAGGLALGSSSVDPVQLRLLGVRLGQGAVAAAGVQILATEYGSGLIRMTLLAVPRRLDVLAAKAAVLTALVAPAAVLGVGVAVLGLSPDGGLLRAAFGSVLHLILIGLLGLGVAAVVRSSAAAMGIVLSLLYLMPMLLRMLPDPDWQRILYRTTPATAVQALTTTVDNAILPLGPWSALGVVAAWSAGALALGALLLHRRDA